MLIYHIATASDWAEARRTGSYTTSTRGRRLEEEGFIHAAYREQVPVVFRRFYAGVREPLVLLAIDTDRLDVPRREEDVDGEGYPHVLGPLRPRAVKHADALDERGGTASVTSMFIGGAVLRMALALVVMLLTAVTSQVAGVLYPSPEWAPLAGAAAGFGLGMAVVAVVLQVRRRR